MNKLTTLIILGLFCFHFGNAQDIIPIDTTHYNINAKAYILENFNGKEAIYLQAGTISPKNLMFLNGTIEFDVYLKKQQAFPGVYFRVTKEQNAEQFYLRPHLPEKPDANQAIPVTKGISPWQLYFGSKYSFAYNYKYNDWTHVKIVVNGTKAQVYLDHAKKPNLSWDLFHPEQEGELIFGGGNRSGMHLANIKIDKNKKELVDFKPGKKEPIKGLIPEWEVSDKFEEKLLDGQTNLKSLISSRKWGKKIKVEEGVAANISRQVNLRDKIPGNTVFTKIIINSKKDQTKLFEFGYSDRVVAILNGKPIYKGNNNYRSRDYRYLGTIGLFDAIYLNLKKGENVLLLAVSENFGGWLVTGRFENKDGIKIK